MMILATVLFLAVSLTIIFGLTGPVLRQGRAVSDSLTSRQSYFIAEAGVEDVVYRLKTGQSVGSTVVLGLGGDTATITTSNVSGGKEVLAVGDASGRVRKIKANLIVGSGVAFHYGIQVGAGGFDLSNNAGVNGNVYSNSNITGSNGSFITGDASATDSISGVNVGGQSQIGVAPQDFPISAEQITAWQNEATAGGIIGGKEISGTGNLLGPTKIEGDLKLSNGAELVVTGTLWVTGEFKLSNNSVVRLSSGYGSSGGMIIVNNSAELSNGSNLYGSGTSGSYLLLVSTSSLGDAIKLANNASAVILYAPNGTIQLSNNAQVKQITAKKISLANGAVIDYEQGLVDAAFTSGPGGGYEVSSWKEVE